MTNFEEACKMSAEKWADTIKYDNELHKFSKNQIDSIKEKIYKKKS